MRLERDIKKKPKKVSLLDLYGSVRGLPNQSNDFEREIDEAMEEAMLLRPPRVEVRRLTPDDWQIDRELRLAALADAPFAFGSTLEEAQRVTNEEWRERLRTRIRFNARQDGVDVGAVGVILPDGETTAELVGMWVHPAARGKGAGDALVQAVLSWSRESGASNVHLWVTKGNLPAERLYARNCFTFTGEEQPTGPADPILTEVGMDHQFT